MKKIPLSDKGSASLFDLASLHIDTKQFGDKLLPFFSRLAWDSYELRGRQLATLKSWLLDNHQAEVDQTASKLFLAGECAISDLKAFQQLNETQKNALQAMPLRRKRAVATFFLSRTNANEQWHVERRPTDIFVQTDSTFYPAERQFSEMESAVTEDEDFQKILHFLPQLLSAQDVHPKKLKVICHQVSLLATPDTPGHGSPEGIHQDGMDFIVSALVIHRENIEGGLSRIYHCPTTGNYELDFSHLLQPGQGLFHADRNTQIWHDVTPVTLTPGTAQGRRNTLGFDLEIML